MDFSLALQVMKRPVPLAKKVNAIRRVGLGVAAVVGTAAAGIASGDWGWFLGPPTVAAIWFAAAAFGAETELRELRDSRSGLSVGWQKVHAPETDTTEPWFDQHPEAATFLISFLYVNPKYRGQLTVSLVSRSTRGLSEEYPQGDQQLHWYGVSGPNRDVTPNASPRVDVAVVAPSVNAIRFLGPEMKWQPLTVTGGTVTGRIVIEPVGSMNAGAQFDFTLSTGTVHPPGIGLTPVPPA